MSVKSHINVEPGIKITAQMSPVPSESDLALVKQMGVKHVVLWTNGEQANYDYFTSRRELFENAGLKIYGFGNLDVHNQDAIVLNLPNRDEKVEEYKRQLIMTMLSECRNNQREAARELKMTYDQFRHVPRQLDFPFGVN